MKKLFLVLIIGVFLLTIPFLNFAQIQVFESEKSDTTSYTSSDSQDTIFIVYKDDNNMSTITLFADLNGIDSLNFEWFKYDRGLNVFKSFREIETAKTDTVFFGTTPGENMNDYEGGYRVNIYNEEKGIDTIFTMWLWYQDFFINTVSVYSSKCEELELVADTSFHDDFIYYDLSVEGSPIISLTNRANLEWTIDSESEADSESDKWYGVHPIFLAPVVPTTYTVYAKDLYGFVRERTINIDETKFDNRGYPYLRAAKAEFSGIHGVLTDGVNDKSSDTVTVEAPYGVWFFNDADNAEEFEWVFYKHKDWVNTDWDWDTTLYVTENFEPIDSIYYKYPRKDSTHTAGYDVKLSVWGPVYNSNGNMCRDTMYKVDFVIVTPTKFPRNKIELPNVFTPKATNNNYFYFLENSLPKSIKYFSVKIYNRWGNKVYDYEDNDGSWQQNGESEPGWNGTTRVGTKAKPGVYYYAILATGWNGHKFEVGGYVHIFY